MALLAVLFFLSIFDDFFPEIVVQGKRFRKIVRFSTKGGGRGRGMPDFPLKTKGKNVGFRFGLLIIL